MKKLFTFFALGALLFTACEKKSSNEVATNLKLQLTSDSVMHFDAAGGDGQISFSLTEDESRAAAPVVEGSTAAEWISNLRTEESNIHFSVAANDGDARNATIKVSYGTQSILVMVQQAGITAADKNFTATHLGGTYYGKFITSTGYNYFVILGDQQAVGLKTKGYNATEYRFDIYAAESSAFNYTHRIPVGTYTIDHARSGNPYTIDGYQSCSYLYDSNDNTSAYLNATLVVTEDSIIADIEFLNGQIHHVEYHGSTLLEDYTEPTYADVYPVSQYTSDINFNVKEGYISAYYRGDWFGIGYDNWFLHMIEHKAGFSGVYLLFDFIVPKSAGGFENLEGFVGEYTIFSEHPADYAYTIPEGRLRDDSNQLHAWFLPCENGQIDMSKAAPLKGGTVKVEKTGNNNYLITVDSNDDNGNKIQGTFEAHVGDYDNQSRDE